MKLVDVKTPDGGVLRMWDIIQRVGNKSPNSRMDVKFCQYLLYKANHRLRISDVDGIWGPKSAGALAGWEKGGTGLVRDGIFDVIPPGGNGAGTISHKFYKLVNIQCFYLMDELYATKVGDVFNSHEETQSTLLMMPDNCEDMPADLRHNMVDARDNVYA